MAHRKPCQGESVSTKKRTTITVETERVLIISRRAGRRVRASPAWCAECSASVEMVPPEVAAALARVSLRTIYRWVEADRLHFTETAEGALLICLNSIPPAR